jgi:hypothetical protein
MHTYSDLLQHCNNVSFISSVRSLPGRCIVRNVQANAGPLTVSTQTVTSGLLLKDTGDAALSAVLSRVNATTATRRSDDIKCCTATDGGHLSTLTTVNSALKTLLTRHLILYRFLTNADQSRHCPGLAIDISARVPSMAPRRPLALPFTYITFSPITPFCRAGHSHHGAVCQVCLAPRRPRALPFIYIRFSRYF